MCTLVLELRPEADGLRLHRAPTAGTKAVCCEAETEAEAALVATKVRAATFMLVVFVVTFDERLGLQVV